ncbi:MAG TPA: hypothetical protein VJ385_06250 [Fibrobacteria bacterium]|nr:hypothetical protein [Fibrobacteria bacterium]
MRPPRAGQSGLSLMEVLVGFFLLATLFAGVVAYNTSQRRALFKSQALTEAMQVAEEALEDAKRTLSDSAAFYSLHRSLQHPSTRKFTAEADRAYTVSLTQDRVPGGGAPLIRSRVTVTWEGGHAVRLGMATTAPR